MISVAEIMSSDVFSVNENASVQSVSWELNAEFISGAPVINDAGQLVGVVSKTDIINATMAGPTATQRVRDIMSHSVESIEATRSASEVVPLFLERRLHRVVVVNESGELVGMVTPLDLLAATARYFHTATDEARLREDGWYAWARA